MCPVRGIKIRQSDGNCVASFSHTAFALTPDRTQTLKSLDYLGVIYGYYHPRLKEQNLVASNFASNNSNSR